MTKSFFYFESHLVDVIEATRSARLCCPTRIASTLIRVRVISPPVSFRLDDVIEAV